MGPSKQVWSLWWSVIHILLVIRSTKPSVHMGHWWSFMSMALCDILSWSLMIYSTEVSVCCQFLSWYPFTQLCSHWQCWFHRHTNRLFYPSCLRHFTHFPASILFWGPSAIPRPVTRASSSQPRALLSACWHLLCLFGATTDILAATDGSARNSVGSFAFKTVTLLPALVKFLDSHLACFAPSTTLFSLSC